MESEERTEDQESIEKMDLPFRRVVALTSIGLATGALLRRIHRALRETSS